MEPHPSSKTQGSQTYTNHLVVRTPLYRHTTIIAHEFSPNKSQRRNCTTALQHLEVWPPSKGLCLPSESPQPAREEEGAYVWHYFHSSARLAQMPNATMPLICDDVDEVHRGDDHEQEHPKSFMPSSPLHSEIARMEMHGHDGVVFSQTEDSYPGSMPMPMTRRRAINTSQNSGVLLSSAVSSTPIFVPPSGVAGLSFSFESMNHVLSSDSSSSDSSITSTQDETKDDIRGDGASVNDEATSHHDDSISNRGDGNEQDQLDIDALTFSTEGSSMIFHMMTEPDSSPAMLDRSRAEIVHNTHQQAPFLIKKARDSFNSCHHRAAHDAGANHLLPYGTMSSSVFITNDSGLRHQGDQRQEQEQHNYIAAMKETPRPSSSPVQISQAVKTPSSTTHAATITRRSSLSSSRSSPRHDSEGVQHNTGKTLHKCSLNQQQRQRKAYEKALLSRAKMQVSSPLPALRRHGSNQHTQGPSPVTTSTTPPPAVVAVVSTSTSPHTQTPYHTPKTSDKASTTTDALWSRTRYNGESKMVMELRQSLHVSEVKLETQQRHHDQVLQTLQQQLLDAQEGLATQSTGSKRVVKELKKRQQQFEQQWKTQLASSEAKKQFLQTQACQWQRDHEAQQKCVASLEAQVSSLQKEVSEREGLLQPKSDERPSMEVAIVTSLKEEVQNTQHELHQTQHKLRRAAERVLQSQATEQDLNSDLDTVRNVLINIMQTLIIRKQERNRGQRQSSTSSQEQLQLQPRSDRSVVLEAIQAMSWDDSFQEQLTTKGVDLLALMEQQEVEDDNYVPMICDTETQASRQQDSMNVRDASTSTVLNSCDIDELHHTIEQMQGQLTQSEMSVRESQLMYEEYQASASATLAELTQKMTALGQLLESTRASHTHETTELQKALNMLEQETLRLQQERQETKQTFLDAEANVKRMEDECDIKMMQQKEMAAAAEAQLQNELTHSNLELQKALTRHTTDEQTVLMLEQEQTQLLLRTKERIQKEWVKVRETLETSERQQNEMKVASKLQFEEKLHHTEAELQEVKRRTESNIQGLKEEKAQLLLAEERIQTELTEARESLRSIESCHEEQREMATASEILLQNKLQQATLEVKQAQEGQRTSEWTVQALQNEKSQLLLDKERVHSEWLETRRRLQEHEKEVQHLILERDQCLAEEQASWALAKRRLEEELKRVMTQLEQSRRDVMALQDKRDALEEIIFKLKRQNSMLNTIVATHRQGRGEEEREKYIAQARYSDPPGPTSLPVVNEADYTSQEARHNDITRLLNANDTLTEAPTVVLKLEQNVADHQGGTGSPLQSAQMKSPPTRAPNAPSQNYVASDETPKTRSFLPDTRTKTTSFLHADDGADMASIDTRRTTSTTATSATHDNSPSLMDYLTEARTTRLTQGEVKSTQTKNTKSSSTQAIRDATHKPPSPTIQCNGEDKQKQTHQGISFLLAKLRARQQAYHQHHAGHEASFPPLPLTHGATTSAVLIGHFEAEEKQQSTDTFNMLDKIQLNSNATSGMERGRTHDWDALRLKMQSHWNGKNLRRYGLKDDASDDTLSSSLASLLTDDDAIGNAVTQVAQKRRQEQQTEATLPTSSLGLDPISRNIPLSTTKNVTFQETEDFVNEILNSLQ
jgi:hypothetical protein